MRGSLSGVAALRCAFLVLMMAAVVRMAHADALSDGRFREEVATVLRAIRPGVEVLPGPDPAELRTQRRTVALTNLYPLVAGLSGAQRRQEIERFLSATFKNPAAGAGDVAQDYAAIRPRLRVQLVPQEILQPQLEIANRQFSETLFVVYVLDEPDRYRYVTRAMLAAWKVDPAAVEAAAVENLAEASKTIPVNLGLGDDGAPAFAITTSGDDYDAARLLLPRYLEEIRKALKVERITLAVPTRDILMAWPADIAARHGLAAEVRRIMRGGPYGRSDELFRFDRSGLRPLNAAERADHGR